MDDLPGILMSVRRLSPDDATVGGTALVAALRQTIVRQEQARSIFFRIKPLSGKSRISLEKKL